MSSRKASPSDSKTLERVRVQRRSGQPSEPFAISRNITITQVDRKGEQVWVFPDGDRHEKRVQRALLSDVDSIFWATLSIACGSPGDADSASHGATKQELAKRYGHLAKARNDLDSFFEFYKPMQIGSPDIVVPHSPGLSKSPGFFDRASRLNNPTLAQLKSAIVDLRDWIDTNQEDPEYVSFQFNFCFSGHGELHDDGSATIVLADGEYTTDELARLFLKIIPREEIKPTQCRLDLYLDCCHSAAIAHGIERSLVKLQSRVDPSQRSKLRIGQIYCASLDDEDSFEIEDLPYSLFTFAFLNECSRKRPEGADRVNLGLRDIGWYTEGDQHPILIDFTAPEGWAMKFPAHYYLTFAPAGIDTSHYPRPSIDVARLQADPVGESIRLGRAFRTICVEVEKELVRNPELHKPFSRDEVLTNARFPFL